ncbi:MAG: tetratricopeptide repeat protein [Crocinitomicaceae bacterium]|nr:tetratricopeptide repeat protein [Crocinitomicaceae bacterium]MBK8924474.1 tetratricopeptide repeat protein [Crocinitomicaceae bacterium]
MKRYIMMSCFCFSIAMLSACAGNDDEVIYDEKQDDFISRVDYDEFSKELVDLENKILSQTPPDENLLIEATTKFQDFAGYFPEDPKAPEYLLKASDYAYTLQQYEKSVKILDRIITEYPQYNRMEDVMFNKASHLDFELRDTTRAKEAYQQFMDKFPQSDLVDDAQSRIENIEYSAEELIEKFMKERDSKPQ